MLEHMEDTYPEQQESVSNVKKRVDMFREKVTEYIQPGNQKTAIVTHSMFLKVLLTKPEYWENPENENILPSQE